MKSACSVRFGFESWMPLEMRTTIPHFLGLSAKKYINRQKGKGARNSSAKSSPAGEVKPAQHPDPCTRGLPIRVIKRTPCKQDRPAELLPYKLAIPLRAGTLSKIVHELSTRWDGARSVK